MNAPPKESRHCAAYGDTKLWKKFYAITPVATPSTGLRGGSIGALNKDWRAGVGPTYYREEIEGSIRLDIAIV